MFDTATPIHGLEHLQKVLEPYPYAYDAVVLAGLVLLAWIANWITKRILVRGLQKLMDKFLGGRGQDQGMRLKVVPRLANVVPALVLSAGISIAPHLPQGAVEVIQKLCHAFIILTVALGISRAMDVVDEVYERRRDAKDQPIKGYLQVAKIIMFVLVGLAVIASLSGVDFSKVITGLGAMTAVLILVFQDTLLSLVASVQISSDGRVRRGDWIEMPGQNANGDVIDIALHTITVRNFDMTVTTVPTKMLISQSFKNWRGMTESGGRRIMRSLFLDQHSVRFLTQSEIESLSRMEVLHDYLDHKQSELSEWNGQLQQRGVDQVNQRRITNLGTFRAYVQKYLENSPHIAKDKTLLVRQLQPTTTGLPLEIYCFSNDIRWAYYEQIQADIFDHLLSVLPMFGLRVFQESSDAMLMAGAQQLGHSPADAVVANNAN